MNEIVVIVEDLLPHARPLERMAKLFDFRTKVFDSAIEANEELDKWQRAGQLMPVAAVVVDLQLKVEGDFDGWDVIAKACNLTPRIKVLVRSSHVSGSVGALGQKDRLRKLLPNMQFIGKDRPESELEQWFAALRAGLSQTPPVVATGSKLGDVLHDAAIYANSSLPVLIVGQSGTGKEAIARQIHLDSGRSAGPFRAVNCASLNEHTGMAELFGSLKGSYTDAGEHKLGLVLEASGYQPGANMKTSQSYEAFLRNANELKPSKREVSELLELAHGGNGAGTLFLDEVDCLPASLAGALLRVLSSGDVRPLGYSGEGVKAYCRIIAASNNLEKLKGGDHSGEAGSAFRRDLYFRLSGVILQLPAIHERGKGGQADIEAFIADPSTWAKLGIRQMAVAPGAVERIVSLYRDDLRSQEFPEYREGNFRPLIHLLHRSALRARDAGEILLEHVDSAIKHGTVQYSKSLDDSRMDTESSIIRSSFASSLQELGIQADPAFNKPMLTDWTRTHAVETASAFLCCCLIRRSDGGFYRIGEIEKALTKLASPSNWVNSTLTKESVRDAALRILSEEHWPELKPGATIEDSVKLIRRYCPQASTPKK